MSETTPQNVILASSSITEPGVIDHLNTILEAANLGELGPPVTLTRASVALPVSADPGEVVAALRGAPGGSDHNPETPASYGVHTIEHRSSHGNLVATVPFTQKFMASGLKTGHGTTSWEVLAPRAMPPAPPWPPAGKSPVVVVLDSGVQPHTWFPQTTDPSFRIDPPDLGPLPTVFDPTLDTGDFGAYWGHATFLAGLIRLHAPAARVMSVKLMNNAGILDDRDILPVLGSLSRYKYHGGAVDVVLMAFGRPKQPGEADPKNLKDAIAELAANGVKFVASAGNAHSDTETLPACLARHPDSPVVSVGAGISAKDREWYSNYGPWVRRWRPGTVVSVMPLAGPNADPNGFALWSGTSFSAAIYAGELAQQQADERQASDGS
jgi:subtilisin family serine protease